MIVRTHQDLELIFCNCDCLPPSCEAPRRECESYDATMRSTGWIPPSDYVDPDLEPLEEGEERPFRIYKTRKHTKTITVSMNTLDNGDGEVGSGGGTESVLDSYSEMFEGGNSSFEDCWWQESTIERKCEVTWSYTESGYARHYQDGEPVSVKVDQHNEWVESLAGTQTDEYKEWAKDWTDESWQAAHDAWKAAADAAAEEREAYDSAYAQWVSDGEIGEPPVEPEEFTDPEPPVKPDENYGECVYRERSTTTTYAGWWNSLEENEVQEWELISVVPFISSQAPSQYVETTNEVTYEGSMNEEQWQEHVREKFIENVSFDNNKCLGENCAARNEAVYTGLIAMAKVRYRMGIPLGDRWEAITAEWKAWDEEDEGTRGEEPLKTTLDVAHAAWVIAMAAWEAADPLTRGAAPIEPTKRSTYQMQWDEMFFPASWVKWRTLRDAYEAAQEAHDAWTKANSDERGDEPTIPDLPEAPDAFPTLVVSREWTYNGTDEFSEWFEMNPPETPGQVEIRNMLVKCYRSARTGVVPTAHGPTYEID